MVAAGLAAGCSIYEPLDRGSTVPWAQAQQGTRGGGSAEARAGHPAIALSDERYRVRRGDRLGDLARSFKVSVSDLAQINDLAPPYIIRVGQQLKVPAGVAGAGPEPTVLAGRTSRPREIASVPVAPHAPVRTTVAEANLEPKRVAALEPAAGPSADALPTPDLKPEKAAARPSGAGSSNDRYTVRQGETLSEIALSLDVGVTELARANDIGKPYRIRAGQKLAVPKRAAPETTTVHLGRDEGSVRLATGDPPPLRGNDFLWPVNGKVIGAFGPIDQWRRRDGIDIAARRGAPVLAAQDGIVAYAGDGIRGYGQMILLRHDQGYITTYAHNATLLVEVGEVVRRGQLIARVGDTGDAKQSMLHFELRKGRTPIDPQTRLVRSTTTMASSTQ